MSGDVDGEGAQILTELDAVGNTTKAITKGIAIATAVLAATALFGSFTDAWSSTVQNLPTRTEITEAPSQFVQAMFNTQIVTPTTLVGLLLGAAVVFLFSGLAINAVDPRGRRHRLRGAAPVPRAPRDHGRHREARSTAASSTSAREDSLRELATPGLLAALAPIAVGFGLGVGAAGRLPRRRHRHRRA